MKLETLQFFLQTQEEAWLLISDIRRITRPLQRFDNQQVFLERQWMEWQGFSSEGSTELRSTNFLQEQKNSDFPPRSTARPRIKNHPKHPAPEKVRVFAHTLQSKHLFLYRDGVDSWIRVESGCVRPPSHQNSDHFEADGRDENKGDR